MPYKSRSSNYATGERHGRAKLTWADVKRVRENKEAWTQRKWASELKVSQATIYRVQNDKNWKG